MVSWSFTLQLCCTHTARLSTRDKHDVVWSFLTALNADLKEALSPPFTCPLLVSREKGHAFLTQHVVHCLGSLRRSETMKNTPPVMCDYWTWPMFQTRADIPITGATDTSLAWWTRARMWVKATSDLFQLLTGIRWEQNNLIQNLQNKKINMHEIQYHITGSYLSVMPVSWSPER